MILPQAASSNPASYVSSLGSPFISSPSGASAASSAFQSLLQTAVSGFPANAAPMVPTAPALQATNSMSKEAGSSNEDQDQPNVASPPATAPDQAPNPILLALFGLMPVETSAAATSSSNPLTVFGDTHGKALSGDLNHGDFNNGDSNKTDSSALMSALAAALTHAAAPLENAPVASANQNATLDAVRSAGTLQRTASDMLASSTAAAAQGPVQRFEAASSSSGAATPIQPVFTLAIRPESGLPQTIAQEQSGTQQTASVENSSNFSPATQPPPDQTLPAISMSGGSATPEAVENTSPANDVASSAAAIPAVTMAKPDCTGSGLDNKSSGDEPGDKQAAAAAIETAPLPGPAAGAPAQFQVPESRPVTEYVHADETPATHANAPVTDIRLQVDGAANQHIDVRLSQQSDGLHVTLRSNDPALTQSLQERVPELTTRLEQHHYQTEVLLPGANLPGRFGEAHASANLQQDLEGRQHGSAGQGNSQNKQNQQQKQQPRNEEDEFQDLLG